MKASALFTALGALAVVAVLPRLQAQELPEGKGKDLVQAVCSSCHGLDAVVAQRADKQGWDNIVSYMVSRGMIATDDEYATMVNYLAKAFPPDPAPAKPAASEPAQPATAEPARPATPEPAQAATPEPAKPATPEPAKP